MRLRILELPPEKLGPAVQFPFCLVFDNVTTDQGNDLDDAAESLKETTGARAVLIFEHSIDLPKFEHFWEYGDAGEEADSECPDVPPNEAPGTARNFNAYDIGYIAQSIERPQCRRNIAQAGPFTASEDPKVHG